MVPILLLLLLLLLLVMPLLLLLLLLLLMMVMRVMLLAILLVRSQSRPHLPWVIPLHAHRVMSRIVQANSLRVLLVIRPLRGVKSKRGHGGVGCHRSNCRVNH